MVDFDRGNNKAIILGYDEIIVSPISTKSCRYCLAANEVEALLALCEYIYWETRWESNTDAPLDISLIRDFANDLDFKLMTPCCDDIPLSRFTEDGIYQTSDDGGVTYHDDISNDPRNGTVGFPPISGSDGSDKRCQAANSIVTYYKGNVALIQTAKDNEATASDISAILIGTLIVLGVITGGWLFAFLGGLIALIYANVTAELWEAAFDDAAWHTLLCIFYCNMGDDASFTLDQWQEIIGEIETAGLDSIAADFFVQTLKGMRETGLTNAARSGYGGSLDCFDCGCADCVQWYYNVNGGGTPENFTQTDECTWQIVADEVSAGHWSASACTTLDQSDNTICSYIDYAVLSGAGSLTITFFPCGSNSPSGLTNISTWLVVFESNAPLTMEIISHNDP